MRKPMYERINAKLLRSDMVLFGDTQETLASYLGIAPSTLSHKIGGYQCFTLDQMDRIRTRYDMSPERFVNVFFSE